MFEKPPRGEELAAKGLQMRYLRATPNGSNRPEAVIQASCRERLLPDRKADIAYEEIIVRRSNRFDCPLCQA